MTPEEFKRQMEIIRGWEDDDSKSTPCTSFGEEGHRKADYLMCTALKELGYGEGIEIFRSTDKWFA
jgi:hypothetical protein